MKRYPSFKSLKKVSDSHSNPAAAKPQAEEKIIAFLNLVRESVKTADKPEAHD
ncbi:hypothetical protein [Hymenobacter edaphi]|uniref:hypothetical protein n=1 Tax=Hymenobacter edaphi TaxID=2211146 RepID=UPI001403C970|nr:hypothetical protein [Hymenobacter edaphi]